MDFPICDCAVVVLKVIEDGSVVKLSVNKLELNTFVVIAKSELIKAKFDLSFVFQSAILKKQDGDSDMSKIPSLSSSISSKSITPSLSESVHLLYPD